MEDLKVRIEAILAGGDVIPGFNKQIREVTNSLAKLSLEGKSSSSEAKKLESTLIGLTKAKLNLKNQISNVTSSLQTSRSGFTQLSNSVEGIKSGISSAIGLIGSLGAVFVGVKASIASFSAAFDFAKDVTLVAARTETLGVVVQTIGKNAGYSKEQIDGYVNGVKKMGITTQESYQTIARMIQANFDLSKSQDLARLSQDAAVIAGVNSSEALQGILHGIVTQQPEVLRTYGIVVNLQKAYSDYAKEHKISALQIDAHTKQQIALNEVLKQSKTIAGAYEAAMSTPGKILTSMARYTQEAANTIGQGFLPVMKVVLETMKGFLENENLMFWFKNLASAISTGVLKIYEFAKGWLDSISKIFGGKKAFEDIQTTITNLITNGFDLLIDVLNEIKPYYMELATALKNLWSENGSAILQFIKMIGEFLITYFVTGIKTSVSVLTFLVNVFNFVITAIKNVKQWFDNLYNTIQSSTAFKFLSVSLDLVIISFKLAWQGLKIFAEAIWNVLKTPVEWVIGAFEKLGEWIGKLWEWFKDTTFVQGITIAFDAVSEAIKTLVGWMESAYQWAKKLVGEKEKQQIQLKDASDPTMNMSLKKIGNDMSKSFEKNFNILSKEPKDDNKDKTTGTKQHKEKQEQQKDLNKAFMDQIKAEIDGEKLKHQLTVSFLEEEKKKVQEKYDIAVKEYDLAKENLQKNPNNPKYQEAFQKAVTHWKEWQSMFDEIDKEAKEHFKNLYENGKSLKGTNLTGLSDEGSIYNRAKEIPDRNYKTYTKKIGKDPFINSEDPSVIFEDIKNNFKAIEDVSSTISDTFSSMMSVLKIGADTFIGQLISGFQDVLSVVNMIVSVMNAMSAVKGFLSLIGLIPGGGMIAAVAGGGMAKGGDVINGVPYLVGEAGMELFIPNQSGTIIPNGQLSQYINDNQRVKSLSNILSFIKSGSNKNNQNINLTVHTHSEIEKTKATRFSYEYGTLAEEFASKKDLG